MLESLGYEHTHDTEKLSMELRDIAWRIVTTDSLDEKLAEPTTEWTDQSPALDRALPMSPGRPANLQPVSAREAKVPKLAGLYDREQRARIVHSLANHELQAVELFAWALLAYPTAPRAFRRGLLQILRAEQRHARLYLEYLATLGTRLGDYPVSAYFWGKAADMQAEPAAFVAAMALTFEQANLDHAADAAKQAYAIGDPVLQAVLDQVHAEEIRHVRFGWVWLRRFKRHDEDMWDAWTRHLPWPLQASKAKGRRFDRVARERAGLDPPFVDAVQASLPLDTPPPPGSPHPRPSIATQVPSQDPSA